MTPSVLYPPGDSYYNFQRHHYIPQNLIPRYKDCFEYYQIRPSYLRPSAYSANQYYYNTGLMAAATSNELADFQRLSDEYRAELPGPLISAKVPISSLVTEYSQADPAFVVKTAALARSYTNYRIIKGDGQCGWRGAVFGYFETLLRLGDIGKVQEERVRLRSFEDAMPMAGIDYEIIADMFDCTWELFDDIMKAVEQRDMNEEVVLAVLNDVVRSDSILYHFKMMTSAFMQLHANTYENFMLETVEEYRASRLAPSNQEIDQIGLQALTDAVIAPANFSLDVLYLDRSIGGEVTPHCFVADPLGKPTIRLLYRPGHYDMIYKEVQTVQTFYQRDSLIPQELEMANPGGMPSELQAYFFSGPQESLSHSQNDFYYNMGQPPNSFDSRQLVCSMEVPQPYQFQYPSPASTHLSSPCLPTTPLLSTCPKSQSTLAKKHTNEPQIRLNANCFNYGQRHESVPLSTQTYGSAAALSPAHFRNQEFQPQMWRAEEEYAKS